MTQPPMGDERKIGFRGYRPRVRRPISIDICYGHGGDFTTLQTHRRAKAVKANDSAEQALRLRQRSEGRLRFR